MFLRLAMSLQLFRLKFQSKKSKLRTKVQKSNSEKIKLKILNSIQLKLRGWFLAFWARLLCTTGTLDRFFCTTRTLDGFYCTTGLLGRFFCTTGTLDGFFCTAGLIRKFVQPGLFANFVKATKISCKLNFFSKKSKKNFSN